ISTEPASEPSTAAAVRKRELITTARSSLRKVQMAAPPVAPAGRRGSPVQRTGAANVAAGWRRPGAPRRDTRNALREDSGNDNGPRRGRRSAWEPGAGEAIRTPDPNLGKVVLYP